MKIKSLANDLSAPAPSPAAAPVLRAQGAASAVQAGGVISDGFAPSDSKQPAALSAGAAAAARPLAASSVLILRQGGSGSGGALTASEPAARAAPVLVDLPDPAPAAVSGAVGKRRIAGSLFAGAPKASDVLQGRLSDCFFAATCASLAATQPDLLRSLISDNGDGTFTARLWQWQGDKPSHQIDIAVDADLYVDAASEPLYGHGPQLAASGGTKGTVLWFALLEKAYAQFMGDSYDPLAGGGTPGAIMSRLLGTLHDWQMVGQQSRSELLQAIEAAVANKLPMVAETHADDGRGLYAGSGLYAWHSYSVVGAEQIDGECFVTLRNPWGSQHGGGSDATSGTFSIPLDTFARLFNKLYTARVA